MCGIAGSYSFQRQGINSKQYFDWCLKSMHHRGPDSNGYWSNDQNYDTAFVRLAIRDLSNHGDQPMHSACGRYVLSFNGEIYNTDKFKPALLKDGVQFISTADTEVLLYALIKWGSKVIAHLNGIFVFAFYDKQTNELLLARDRLGIKPLYVGMAKEGLVYSSQYDHIINHPYCAGNGIDTEAVHLYMSLGYVPDGKGFFTGTQLLPHGHYMQVKESGYETVAFYDYPVQTVANNNRLDQVLQQCVNQQMVSDVPLGTFMSGGVDSTLVTGAAARKTKVKSFTIGVEDKRLDESDDAAAFAQYFNTEHQNRLVTETDLLATIQNNTAAFNEPFADFSSIPTLLLSQFARQQVTVALSGDGGDELFWGYPRNRRVFQHADIMNKHKSLRYLHYMKERLLKQPKTVSKRHLRANSLVDYYYQSLFIAGASVHAKDIVKDFSLPQPYFLQKAHDAGFHANSNVSVMNMIRKLEVDLHLQRILIKVDRASMYHSLEVRVPLLDNDMIDYSIGVDYTTCIQGDNGKANLKKLLAAQTSEALVYKPKKGFDIPMRQWLNNKIAKDVEEKLMNMPAHLAIYFNRNGLQNMLQQHKAGTFDHTWLIWAVYSLVLWDAHHKRR